MKQLLTITFTFCFCTFAFAQEYGWINLSDVLPNESFSDVYAIENEVWITSSSSSKLFYSDNGGVTEFTTYSTPDDFLCIHMINSNLGYAGAYNGGVYKTENGGAEWTLLFPLTGAAVNDITFPPTSGEPGYCCGEAGNISSIISSGTSSMINLTVALTSIAFPVSSSEGWVCGIDIIYHYNGTGWVGQGGPSGTRNGIHFIDNNNGWIVGSDGNGNGQITHTTNGGTNWTLQSDPSPSSGSLAKVFFLNTQEGWAGGNFGRVLYTSDGGDNWSAVNTGTTSLIRGIYFTDSSNGYIVGNEGNAVKYTLLSESDSINATLSNIEIDDTSLENFNSGTYEYSIELPTGTTEIPQVSATAAISGADVNITQASSLSGTASIVVTAKDGQTQQIYTIHFSVLTGIEDFEQQNELNIYPNPASDIIYFKVPAETTPFNLKIIDVHGRVVCSQKSFSAKSIDVSELQAGVYFLSLQNGKKTYSSRFVKK